MPSYKTAFGSFLKTEDLQGKTVKVQIESVALEEVKGEDGTQNKLVMHFVGKDKALVLNRTNCEALAELSGSDDYAAWAGGHVVLYPTTTRFGNKIVPCLRIRGVGAPAAAAPPPPPVTPVEPLTDDEIPF